MVYSNELKNTDLTYFTTALESTNNTVGKNISTYCNHMITLCNTSKKVILNATKSSLDSINTYKSTAVNNIVKTNNEINDQLQILNQQLNSMGIKDKEYKKIKIEYDNLSIKFKMNQERKSHIFLNTFFVSKEFKDLFTKLILSDMAISTEFNAFISISSKLIDNSSVSHLAIKDAELTTVIDIVKKINAIFNTNKQLINDIIIIKKDMDDQTEMVELDAPKEILSLMKEYMEVHKRVASILSICSNLPDDDNTEDYSFILKTINTFITFLLSIGRLIIQECIIIKDLL